MSRESGRCKLVVSYPFLQVLGHWAGKEADWSAFEKLRFWLVFLTSFFGSLRIGELLSEGQEALIRRKHCNGRM